MGEGQGAVERPSVPLDERFSTILPTLQVRVNSSSLGPFKTCPRKYQYSIIEGWEAEGGRVHLTFGSLVHAGTAGYEVARARGASHDEAVEGVVLWALRTTWDSKLGRGWMSGDPNKNRLSLVRSLVWYLDQYNQPSGGTAPKTLMLGDALAVEIPFAFGSGFVAESTGEEISFIGTLDRLVELGNQTYVLDTKTTAWAIEPSWFKKFTPDNQFSLYSIAGRVVLDRPVAGLILDGMQVGATFTRFNRGLVPRSDEFLDEWLKDSYRWLGEMERCAVEDYWPMNDRGCGMYGGCEFREVCSLAPSRRAGWLERNFRRKQLAGNEDLV